MRVESRRCCPAWSGSQCSRTPATWRRWSDRTPSPTRCWIWLAAPARAPLRRPPKAYRYRWRAVSNGVLMSCHVLREDAELADAISPERRQEAIEHCTAREVRVPSGEGVSETSPLESG